jgi:hypothetical protein
LGCKKHELEITRVITLQQEFENQWLKGAITISRLVEFMSKLKEVEDLATWVHGTINNHIIKGGCY